MKYPEQEDRVSLQATCSRVPGTPDRWLANLADRRAHPDTPGLRDHRRGYSEPATHKLRARPSGRARYTPRGRRPDVPASLDVAWPSRWRLLTGFAVLLIIQALVAYLAFPLVWWLGDHGAFRPVDPDGAARAFALMTAFLGFVMTVAGA